MRQRGRGAPRLVMAVPSLPSAGMELVVARLTRGLRRRGWEVRIVCIEELGELGLALQDEGIAVDVVPTPGVWPNFFPSGLADWFRRVDPDVVHVHSGAWLKTARAARSAGVGRVVHTVHGLLDVEPAWGPFLKRRAAGLTDVIAVVSRPLERHMREVGVDPAKIVVVPNGIDTEEFRPGERSDRLRRRFGWPPGTLVIGHVGRFASVKNHRLLLQAFARIAGRQPDVTLALVGDGPLRSEIEALARELEVADRVGFAGLASDLHLVYPEFDVFTLCSTAEGSSLSILEAMACGLPIVATAVGGSPDLLDHGGAGRLVPSGDPDALSRALLDMVEDPQSRLQLGRAARARALAFYDHQKTLDSYEALYVDQGCRPGCGG